MKVPEGWKVHSLEMLAEIQTGLSKSASRTGEFTELPYLRVANVKDGYLDLSEVKTIQVPQHMEKRYTVKVGDVLLTEGGDFDKLGRGSLWKGQIPNCVHQNHIFVVRTGARLLNIFFAYQSQSPYGRSYFLRCAKRSTNLASINATQLKQFPVITPPLTEQKKIAEILGACDEAIEAQERLIAQKQQRKKGLMQQLLTGKTRFPQFAGKPWREVHLKDIVKPLSRKNTVGNTNVLTSSAKHGLVSQTDYFNKSVAGVNTSGYYLLKRGEFAYNRSSAKGYPYGAIKRLDLYDEGILSTLYLCFILKNDAEIRSDFLAHFFEAGLLNHGLQSVCQEGARAHGLLNITKSDFYGLKISIPSVEEQAAIEVLLNAQDKEIALQQAKLDQLRNQKKGLMQQLLTGKVRVKV